MLSPVRTGADEGFRARKSHAMHDALHALCPIAHALGVPLPAVLHPSPSCGVVGTRVFRVPDRLTDDDADALMR